MKPSNTGDTDDVAASEEQPGSPGRFQINSVRSRRQSTVKFVDGDTVSRETRERARIFCSNIPSHRTQFDFNNALIFYDNNNVSFLYIQLILKVSMKQNRIKLLK